MAMQLHLHASSKMFENPVGIGFISRHLYESSTSKISNFKIKGSGVHPLRAASLDAGMAASSIMVEEQVKTPKLEKYVHFSPSGDEKSEPGLSIVIVGASGELASSKIFPALFALFNENRLPQNLTIVGYARRKMTDQELRNMISKTLVCRIADKENCDEMMDQFLRRCFYHSGQYSSEEHFLELDTRLREAEGGRKSNRLFYFSIPPTICEDVARCVQRRASSEYGWTRVVLEKPFGQDLESSAQLTKGLRQHLREDQIFRMDHHLGEELISNLLVLRFANLVFEPLWSRNYIRNVQMVFSEDSGVEARGNNFDKCGIIRDIMVNHLLPVLALFTMETPVSLYAEDIRNEKVKVLRSMKPPEVDNVVIGQYKGGFVEGNTRVPGYTDHPTVGRDSLTPTFAAATLFINNRRWDGVPFFLVAGKGLETKRVEIRVQFRQVAGNLFKRKYGSGMDNCGTNELVISVLPDEAIYLKINNKVPGFGMRTDSTDLNLLCQSRYPKKAADGYERLLLDSIEGERTWFMRSDEVEAVWSLFSPVLNELEEKKVVPELYNYGSGGPVGAHYLAAKHNMYWIDHLC